MAEAFAEYLHKRIRGELGFAAEEARDPEAMLAQGYRGSRYSFGYPACPNLADQKQLLALLNAEEIGITLSEEDQLDPEQSAAHRGERDLLEAIRDYEAGMRDYGFRAVRNSLKAMHQTVNESRPALMFSRLTMRAIEALPPVKRLMASRLGEE